MPDRFVDLQLHLLGVDDDCRHAGRTGVGTKQSRSLLGDPRSFSIQAQLLDELPAGLRARAAVCARVAPDLNEAVADRGGVDPTTALEELLEEVAALGRPENPSFAHCSDARRGHGDVRPVESALRPKAELDLPLQRHLDRIVVAGCAVVADVGCERLQLDLAPCRSRARPGEGNRSHGRISGAAFVELPVAREAPGAVDEYADADPGSLGVVDGVDPAVTRRDML